MIRENISLDLQSGNSLEKQTFSVSDMTSIVTLANHKRFKDLMMMAKIMNHHHCKGKVMSYDLHI